MNIITPLSKKNLGLIASFVIFSFVFVIVAIAAVNWTERQPAGDVNVSYGGVGSDADGSNLIAGVTAGRLYTSSDSGANWTERQPAGAANKNWYAIASDADGSNLIAGGHGMRLYTSSDGGANWTERQPAGAADKNWYTAASDADGSNLIVAVGGNPNTGRLYTSSDGGANWTERQPAGDADKAWNSVASDADGSNLIAGVLGGRIYTSSDGGANWTERQPAGDANKNWYSVASDSDGSFLVAAVFGGRLYTSSDSGANWTERQPEGDVNKNWGDVASDADGSNLIAAVYNGKVYLSTDSGVNWSETQPAGATTKAWLTTASDDDGSNLIIGVGGGRLYTGVVSANTAPVATIGTPAQVSASNTVSFTAVVSDVDLNATTLLVQYSTDNSTWASTTLGTVTADSGTVTVSGATISSIDTDSATRTLTIAWLAGTDIANTYDTSVYLRIKPYDGTEFAAAFTTSTAFAVDTRTAATPTDFSGFTSGRDSVNLSWTGTNPTYLITNVTTASTITTSASTYSLSGLSCYTAYAFTVSGVSFIGTTSSASSEISLRTRECGSGGSAGGGGGSSSPSTSSGSSPSSSTTTPPPLALAPSADPAETARLQVTIASLKQQIAERQLQAQTNSYRFTSGFGPGSRGEQVRQLQIYLNDNGFPVALSGAGSKGNETLYFGPATAKALQQLQASRGLTPTPWVGPGTRGILNTR